MDPQRRRFFTGRPAPAARVAPAPAPHWQIVLADGCLMRQRVECRSCAEACDARALRCVPAVGGPQLQQDPLRCSGCGDCLPGCPVQAITLVPPVPASTPTPEPSPG